MVQMQNHRPATATYRSEDYSFNKLLPFGVEPKVFLVEERMLGDEECLRVTIVWNQHSKYGLPSRRESVEWVEAEKNKSIRRFYRKRGFTEVSSL